MGVENEGQWKRTSTTHYFCNTSIITFKWIGDYFFDYLYLIERRKIKNGVSVLTFHWAKTKKDIRKYWWLILLPFVSVIGQIVFAHYAMPTFNEHVMERVEPMLQMGSMFIDSQLLLLAFGEELAFRGLS